ncbi:MAG: ABC-ATPase domain-containing protein [Gemmatimonadetes bacterium]|nr:ABC-ATPase domain-containing protein [Gemmatimonadota bacterium]
MRSAQDLAERVRALDGRGYKAYGAVGGSWAFEDFTLHVDHVQGDPFAAPTRVRVVVPPEVARLPEASYGSRVRALGTAAFLARALGGAAREAPRVRGSGRSGEIDVETPGQEVLAQTAVQVDGAGVVEARFGVGLPAGGRRILGREGARLLTVTVPHLVRTALLASAHDPAEILRHAEVNEDAEHLRASLAAEGLIAFVADGASLPRRSGVDDRPLEGEGVVLFNSPESLRVTLEAPNAGTLTGMGVPAGVTLVVGGGFHGKSTLLRALEAGVYNHRPGDGRERVVADADTVKVRAEDGRAVTRVDISCFIDGLPFGQDTHAFTTPNASGSTSQAATIVEALESGARTLLIDEDTSATNFMIRDRRMQALVPKEGEPITPFVDRVRELHRALGVSTVLVLGGSGDYLDVADTVVAMRRYEPHDVTDAAGDVASAHPTGRTPEAGPPLRLPEARVVDTRCLDARRGRRDVHVKVPDLRTLLFGRGTVDLGAVEQVVSRSQINAIGRALALAPGLPFPPGRSQPAGGPELHARSESPGGSALSGGGSRTVAALLDAVEALLEERGLDALDDRRPGDLSAFRRHELAAALNRLRSLRIV